MPSLRKRVSSYFRQLSFINEPKERKINFDENSMVNKYLQGHIKLKDGPQILYGKNPTDLPNFDLGNYNKGFESIVGCYSGPNGGLTTVKRTEKHLSMPGDDIDFIDTQEEINTCSESQKSPILTNGHTVVDNTTMVIRVAGQEYSVINRLKHKKSRSLGSLSDLGIEIEKTKICTDLKKSQNDKSDLIFLSTNNNKINDNKKGGSVNRIDNDNTLRSNSNTCKNINNNDVDLKNVKCVNKEKTEIDDNGNKSNNGKKTERKEKKMMSEKNSLKPSSDGASSRQVYNLSKSKSDGNPFRHRKQGKIIKITHRPTTGPAEVNLDSRNSPTITIDDSKLPNEWNKKSDFVYGLSDSLYDRNQVTKNKNGDPIADCFGIIARQDSAILAVADGVNWGEKACIAAKSAVHGCLHYLNKTIFNDTKPFINLTIKDDDQTSETESDKTKSAETSHISNTREVFVCLLRAFNCAHDLILENQGMLTTLTVAVVLPLKQKNVKKSEKVEARGISKGENRNGSFKRHTQRTGSNIVNNNNKEEVENYVCCVCNVGDTLAYVYSQKYGVRELTKGSHDINCNRDMRDALGALGPVDGINPELSNLTLSITTLQKGDLIFVASDGLTDNFDPFVCKFAVNIKTPDASKTKKQAGNDSRPSDHQKSTERKEVQRTHSKSPQRSLLHRKKEQLEQTQTQGQPAPKKHEDVPVVKAKAPQKPPRKNREKLSQERISSSRQSVSSERSFTSSISESQKSYDESLKKSETKDEFENPLIVQFMRENSLDEKSNLDSLKSNLGTMLTMPVVQQEQLKRDFSSHKPSSSSQHIKISSSPSAEASSSCSSKKRTQGSLTGPMGLQKSQTTKDVRSAVTGNKTIGFSFTNNRPKPEKSTTVAVENPKYRFLRSKTSIDMRPAVKPILRNEEGLPYVSPLQRYELTLLMMEDILRRGISGQDSGCVTARKLCENLINFTLSITAGKRHTLEDVDLYYNNVNGVLVEVSSNEKKIRRRKALDRVQNLPGKLDHVSIVAYNVGINGI